MRRLTRNIKDINTYIDNLEITKRALFMPDDVVVEHRSNNSKRDFLFVNKKQCKHIPCNPNSMISMCKELAEVINRKMSLSTRVLIVAFAETATAIGNIVADYLPQCNYVMQTTREHIPNSEQLLTFEEEHSHATTQKLLMWADKDKQISLDSFDYVLFLEDEISTGNTILNFINAFTKRKEDMKFGVASICNWQNNENKEKFLEKNIDTFYLIGGSLKDVNIKMLRPNEIPLIKNRNTNEDRLYINNKKPTYIKLNETQKESLFLEERLGHHKNRDLTSIFKEVDNIISKDTESIRIIGTEEFMYIPVMVANHLREKGMDVLCHSTTRSKIDTLYGVEYGTADSIISRHNIPSVYEKDRSTYIYNLEEYTDKTLVLTDKEMNKETLEKYNNILGKYCEDTLVVSL